MRFTKIRNRSIKNKSWLNFIVLMFTINMGFSLIASYYGLNRPFFNIDYLLLIIFFYKKSFLNSLVLLLSLFSVYCIDIILLGLNVFPFINLGDILYLSNFFFSSPALYKILVFGAFLIVIILFFFIRDRLIALSHFSINQIVAVLVLYVILLILSSFQIAPNILNSQSLFFIQHNQSNMLGIDKHGVITDLTTDYASKPLLDEINTNSLKSNKILFIVNESWGETAKPEQQNAILASIYKNKDQLEYIQRGSFSIVGSTIAAEFRELCQKKLFVMDVKSVNNNNYISCIPTILKIRGYRTHSIHAATSMMYNRESWYPLLGLSNRYFYEDLPEGGQCKSFNGRCDVLLVSKVKKLLLDSDKSFVYWLTLNTHAPYDDKLFNNSLDCNAVGLENDTHVCGSYQLQYQFFDALSQLIIDPAMKDVEVFVVGDHPPPLMEIGDGLKAFKNSQVAWLHFKIK